MLTLGKLLIIIKMKNRFLVISAIILSAISSRAAQPSDTLRVLAIGNSFSQDALNTHFGEICEAAGKCVIVGNLFIPGCSLERHYKSLTENMPDYVYHKRIGAGVMVNTPHQCITKGIFDEPWDIVTFQQASAKSGLWETYEPYLGELIRYVRENVPTAGRLMWHQTWAYRNNSANGGLKNYGTVRQMYDAICSAIVNVHEKYGLEIIPSGTAIRNLVTSYEGGEGGNFYLDGSHLSPTMGRYTAACTWFEAIFGESVIGNSYKPDGLIESRINLAQNAAHMAAASPFHETNMRKAGFDVAKAVYDESAVPAYTLPDPLVCEDGSRVKNRRDWENKRRAEILDLFTKECYGKAPAAPDDMKFELVEQCDTALSGKATRKQVRVYFTQKKFIHSDYAYMDLLLYIPNSVKKAPAFLGVNFCGNYGIINDPAVIMPRPVSGRWGSYDSLERGVSAMSWPVETIIDAGYAVVTFYRGDVCPDFDNAFYLGVHRYMNGGVRRNPADDEWGAIAAWSWGLSRALDYLRTDDRIDAGRVAVFGHSRLGKAALWAGATDPRFAMVISNDSGCCGAALSRRRIGECIESINLRFPHWFCNNFKKYNGREDDMPFDQHELLALVSPRPLYVASASKDRWADPVGEGMALDEARKVYALYGKKALKRLGRHVREGKHAILLEDWLHYIEFADRNL